MRRSTATEPALRPPAHSQAARELPTSPGGRAGPQGSWSDRRRRWPPSRPGGRAQFGTCWEAPGLPQAGCSLPRRSGRSGAARVEGALSRSLTTFLPLLPRGVSGVSFPSNQGQSPFTCPPTERTRDLAPGWGVVTWCCLPAPSKMPVPSRRASASMNLMAGADGIGAGGCP